MISTNLVFLESNFMCFEVYLLLNQVDTKDIILIENHYFFFACWKTISKLKIHKLGMNDS